MRLAIFSDIHGNLPALEAVLNDVHGQPFDERYCLGDLVGYGASPDEVTQRLAASSDADVIVFGYTHKPYTKLVDDVLFVNVGSVGKPKDGDWRACYATVDVSAGTAAFTRVEYDVHRAMAAIRQTELPPQFADDLATGGVPTAVRS